MCFSDAQSFSKGILKVLKGIALTIRKAMTLPWVKLRLNTFDNYEFLPRATYNWPVPETPNAWVVEALKFFQYFRYVVSSGRTKNDFWIDFIWFYVILQIILREQLIWFNWIVWAFVAASWEVYFNGSLDPLTVFAIMVITSIWYIIRILWYDTSEKWYVL